MKVSVVKRRDDAIIPTYAHFGDAGADLYANEEVEVLPNETKIISTGLRFEVPDGYELQVRPRSGMSVKTKLRIANTC